MLVVPRVPRTGSTSFQQLLKRKYRGLWSGCIASNLVDAAAMLNKEIARPSRKRVITAVSGHFPYGLHAHIAEPCTYITTSREPVSRVFSLWKLTYRHHLKPIDQWLEEDGFYAHNDVARYMAGADVAMPWVPDVFKVSVRDIPDANRGLLNAAKKNLETFALVGVLERFSAFQSELETLIDATPSQMPWIHGHGDVPGPQTITPRSAARILELNAIDAELHEWIRGIAP